MNANPCDGGRCAAAARAPAETARGPGDRPAAGRPALRSALGALAAFALVACAGAPKSDERAEAGPWNRSFTPPAPLETSRFVLEPAGPQHAERDHAALMASAEHLRTTVFDAWPPPDFSLEQDRRELVRHAAEFEAREAYAYTVLSPDRRTSLGAVWMKPVRALTGDGQAVQLNYWVAAREIPRGLDEHLLTAVLGWLDREWPFAEAILPLRVDNRRAAALARAARLEEQPPPSAGWRLFVHRR